jgi:hypothetical protein
MRQPQSRAWFVALVVVSIMATVLGILCFAVLPIKWAYGATGYILGWASALMLVK